MLDGKLGFELAEGKVLKFNLQTFFCARPALRNELVLVLNL